MKTALQEPLKEHLHTFVPHDALEKLHVRQLLQFLEETNNAYDRSNLVAHVVADAWIVNSARDKVVLVEHKLNGFWLAPGGHCDGDPNVFAAALREAEEETGLTDLTPLRNGTVFDVNAGGVPTRMRHGNLEPAHIHFDVCYAFEAPEDTPLVISDESTNLAWVRLAEIPSLNYKKDHLRRLKKTPRL